MKPVATRRPALGSSKERITVGKFTGFWHFSMWPREMRGWPDYRFRLSLSKNKWPLDQEGIWTELPSIRVRKRDRLSLEPRGFGYG